MINKPKKHHYLAQSYLKNFASTSHKDKIFFQRRSFKEPVLKTIVDVACVGHFYTFENQSGEKDYIVETGLFGMLDSDLAPTFDRLNATPYPFAAKPVHTMLHLERLNISTHVAFQMIRTPGFRAMIEGMAADSAEHVLKFTAYSEEHFDHFLNRAVASGPEWKDLEMSEQERKKLREWILKGKFEIKTGGQYYLGVAIDLGMKTVPLYHMKNMVILKAPRGCFFITSDFPILKVPDKKAPPMYQAGLMGSHIYFPIGSSTALLFVNPIEPPLFRNPLCLDRVPIRILDEPSVKKWNELMVANAEDAIFGAFLNKNLQIQMNSSTKRKRIKMHSPLFTKQESLQVFQQEVVR